MKENPAIEIIKRLKDKRELRRYFKWAGYVIPETMLHVFNSYGGVGDYCEVQSTPKSKEKMFRLVLFYIQQYTLQPNKFNYQTELGKRNMERVDEIIQFCEDNEWSQFRAIIRHIKRNVDQADLPS